MKKYSNIKNIYWSFFILIPKEYIDISFEILKTRVEFGLNFYIKVKKIQKPISIQFQK